MSSRPSEPAGSASLAVVASPAVPVTVGDAQRGQVQVSVQALASGPGERAAQIDLVSVEARTTEFADGTRVRSLTRTEQRIEVVAPEHVNPLAHVATHAPVLGALGGTSETARLLKLDNDDDYTDDDFDDDDEHDLEIDDEDDDEPSVRALPPAPVALPTHTSWSPPFTTVRHGNLTVTVPDISAIAKQLDELLTGARQHQTTARSVLSLVEPLAQQAMDLGFGPKADAAALARLRDEARALAGALQGAEQAGRLADVELDHGQRISQRATGSPRVKERLDALTTSVQSTREAVAEARRLLQALGEAR